MTPRPALTQLVIGTGIILTLAVASWGYSARQTYNEQLRILGQQIPVVARTVADALEPDTDPPETIRRVLAGLQVTPDSAAVIADGQGHVLGMSGPVEVTTGRTLVGAPRLATTTDADHVERQWGIEQRTGGGLIVAIARPSRLAWDRTLPIYRRNLAIATTAVALVLTVLFVTIGRASRGMRHIESMAARVSRGDLSAPPLRPMPSQELDHLQSTMAEMIARVRELQKQVVRQERLAAIGTLVSGVAHEISNPLQSILGSTQVIQAQDDVPESIRGDLSVIQQESVRAGAIIRNLTRFTRQQTTGPSAIRLTEIVLWLTELWNRRLVQQGITLEVDDRSTRVTDAVSSEIQQVALNFLVNAEHAVLNGGTAERRVIVRTRDTESGFVRLEVEDSGPGVSPDSERRLFVPFFTTKPVGEGTGLGLSISYGIIQSHGGTIGYERGALGGALFFFEIPARSE